MRPLHKLVPVGKKHYPQTPNAHPGPTGILPTRKRTAVQPREGHQITEQPRPSGNFATEGDQMTGSRDRPTDGHRCFVRARKYTILALSQLKRSLATDKLTSAGTRSCTNVSRYEVAAHEQHNGTTLQNTTPAQLLQRDRDDELWRHQRASSIFKMTGSASQHLQAKEPCAWRVVVQVCTRGRAEDYESLTVPCLEMAHRRSWRLGHGVACNCCYKRPVLSTAGRPMSRHRGAKCAETLDETMPESEPRHRENQTEPNSEPRAPCSSESPPCQDRHL